eukprot:scaffold659_cov192-Ochromonas_danica.AAC.43
MKNLSHSHAYASPPALLLPTTATTDYHHNNNVMNSNYYDVVMIESDKHRIPLLGSLGVNLSHAAEVQQQQQPPQPTRGSRGGRKEEVEEEGEDDEEEEVVIISTMKRENRFNSLDLNSIVDEQSPKNQQHKNNKNNNKASYQQQQKKVSTALLGHVGPSSSATGSSRYHHNNGNNNNHGQNGQQQEMDIGEEDRVFQEGLVMTVPRLAGMVNLNRMRGGQFYERTQEQQAKRRMEYYYTNQIATTKPSSPRANSSHGTNGIITGGHVGGNIGGVPQLPFKQELNVKKPRQPVEPPVPQSKPIHFANRNRPKSVSTSRTSRPQTFNIVEIGSHPHQLAEGEEEQQGLLSLAVDGERLTPATSPRDPSTIISSALSTARDSLPLPSLIHDGNGSLSGVSQLSCLRESKAIPPPTFVSVCLPAVTIQPLGNHDTLSTIPSSGEELPEIGHLQDKVFMMPESTLVEKVKAMLEDGKEAEGGEVREVIDIPTVPEGENRKKDHSSTNNQSSATSRRVRSAGLYRRPHSASLHQNNQNQNHRVVDESPLGQAIHPMVMKFEEHNAYYHLRPSSSSKSRHHPVDRQKHDQENYQALSPRPRSIQQPFPAGFKVHNRLEKVVGGGDYVTLTGEKGGGGCLQDNFPLPPDQQQQHSDDHNQQQHGVIGHGPPSSARDVKARVMLLAHQIAQELDHSASSSPLSKYHNNQQGFDAPVHILSAPEHLQRLIAEEKERVILENKERSIRPVVEGEHEHEEEAEAIVGVNIHLPVEMVEAIDKQLHRYADICKRSHSPPHSNTTPTARPKTATTTTRSPSSPREEVSPLLTERKDIKTTSVNNNSKDDNDIGMLRNQLLAASSAEENQEGNPAGELVLRWRAFVSNTEPMNPIMNTLSKEGTNNGNEVINKVVKRVHIGGDDEIGIRPTSSNSRPSSTRQPYRPETKVLQFDAKSIAEIFAEPISLGSWYDEDYMKDNSILAEYAPLPLPSGGENPQTACHPQERIVKLNPKVPSSRIDQGPFRGRISSANGISRRKQEKEKRYGELNQSADLLMSSIPVCMQPRQIKPATKK